MVPFVHATVGLRLRLLFCDSAQLLSNEMLGVPKLTRARIGNAGQCAPTGERQSVARIGSHTTSTRSFRCGYRPINCSAAEAPRRQVVQVGGSSTTRGILVSPSKAVLNSLKFSAVSVNSGGCPCGTDEGPQRHAATKRSSAVTAQAMMPRLRQTFPPSLERCAFDSPLSNALGPYSIPLGVRRIPFDLPNVEEKPHHRY